MKVFYSRVSSTDGSQNPERRQLQNLEGFDYVFIDRCSGSIPLYERPKGSQIKKLIDQAYKSIPKSQLAIIPNCGHIESMSRPYVFNNIILPFIIAK